ncbi:MAG: Flp family type IVb pilin [Acetobacteraceae bacterium]|nr:Flp family type IVb pilin [Pseudomonadota bacterium]
MITLTLLRTAVLRTLHDRKGVSATEYTLMVVGIAGVVLAGATTLGGDVSSALHSIGQFLSTSAGNI